MRIGSMSEPLPYFLHEPYEVLVELAQVIPKGVLEKLDSFLWGRRFAGWSLANAFDITCKLLRLAFEQVERESPSFRIR